MVVFPSLKLFPVFFWAQEHRHDPRIAGGTVPGCCDRCVHEVLKVTKILWNVQNLHEITWNILKYCAQLISLQCLCPSLSKVSDSGYFPTDLFRAVPFSKNHWWCSVKAPGHRWKRAVYHGSLHPRCIRKVNPETSEITWQTFVWSKMLHILLESCNLWIHV